MAHADHFREPKLTRNLAIQALFVQTAAELNVPTPTLAVAWTLHHPAVTGAIVGARRPDQLNDIAPALDL